MLMVLFDVKGRMMNAPIPYDSRCPIFIPKSSKLAELLVIYYHSLVLHNGVKETLNQLRTRFET